MPCSFKRERIVSESIDSSDAHVLDDARTSSVPPSTDIGSV